MRWCVVWVLLSSSAVGAAPLDALWQRITTDVNAGQPLVVEAHVALCDNSMIRCGGRGLGDGDDLERNLYWATSGGLRGWFERRGSGWKRLAVVAAPSENELERRTYERVLPLSPAMAARGFDKPVRLVVIAHAWRGKQIGMALDHFVSDLASDGNHAHVVAYLGHNGWMDRPRVAFPQPGPDSLAKGALAIACLSRSWLAGRGKLFASDGESPRVPLVLTADLLFAGAASFEHAVVELGRGGDLAAIREAASAGYAESEDKPIARVRTLFTNQSDRRWPRAPASIE